MSAPRTVFPMALGDQELAPDASPVMVDGMEVLFHRTVGLYPVEIELKPAAPPATPGDRAAPGRRGNGLPN